MRRKQSLEKIFAMPETTNKSSRKPTEFSKFQQRNANSESARISLLYKEHTPQKWNWTKLVTVNDIRRQQFQSKLILLHLRKDCITFLLQKETTATNEGDNSRKAGEQKLKRFTGEISLWRQERAVRMWSHSPLPSQPVYKTLQKNRSRDRNTQEVIIKRCKKYW